MHDMKNTLACPKCGCKRIIRAPDDAHRYLANSICMTKALTVERVPVARYVCAGCGYVENYVEWERDLSRLEEFYGLQ